MKYFLVIFLFYCTSLSAETCKWWFQRYGWKNFNLEKVEDCLKNGSPVIADVEGGRIDTRCNINVPWSEFSGRESYNFDSVHPQFSSEPRFFVSKPYL